MANNYGLGRGLASLIPRKSSAVSGSESGSVQKDSKSDGAGQNAIELDIDSIVPNPHQPRWDFDPAKLSELSESIRNYGIIQPLVVSQNGNQYELIAGERRFQAAKLAGLKSVPVVIKTVGEREKLELAVVENIQRHDLNPIEEAKAYQKLGEEFGLNQEELSKKVGKSRSAVANKTRLLNLSAEIQKALISGQITEGHAKTILAIDGSEKQKILFDMILKNNLTVRQTEDKVKEISVRSHKRQTSINPEIKELENKLVGALGTKVKVVKFGGGGKIIIEYYSSEDLDGILEKIIS